MPYFQFADVIGHVVEKDTLKNIEKNGKTMMLIEIVLEDLQYVEYLILIYLLLLHCIHDYELSSMEDKFFYNFGSDKTG